MPVQAEARTPALIEHSVEPVTPMGMIEAAVAKGAGIDVIDRLMTLQERWDAHQSKKSFIAARSEAKAEISAHPILKNATGHNNKRYANFEAYAKAIDPILSKHGLSYGFETEQDGASIKVTCVLSHRDGFETRNTLVGAADNTGNKNSIQAIGSTLSYLSRYTLKAAFGLSDSEDDDGQAAGGGASGPVSDEQVEELRRLADDAGADIPRLCAFLKIEALPDLMARDFKKAVNAIEAKRRQKGARS